MRVLVACEFSGIVREAFAKRGHDAWSCDLLDTEIPGNHIKGEIFDALHSNWDMVIAFPPCTHLAVSGARWFKEKQKDGRQQQGIDFFMLFVEGSFLNWRHKVAIENPVGIMSTRYRQPDQIIQPWQYGHGETKATCLWLRNLPLLEPTKIVKGREARIRKMPPSENRWRERSRTYTGIAEAMAEQWGKP